MNIEENKIEELAAQADNLIRSAKGKVGRPRKSDAEKKAVTKVEGVPHIRRAQKSAAKLPQLSDGAEEVVNLALSLSHEDLSSVLAHVNHNVKIKTLQSAVSLRTTNVITNGMMIRIISGRHAGKIAKVVDVKRIRCHVTLVDDTSDRILYLFTSEVEPVVPESVQSTAGDIAEAV